MYNNMNGFNNGNMGMNQQQMQGGNAFAGNGMMNQVNMGFANNNGGFQQSQQAIRTHNPLSAEEIQKLTKNVDAFNLGLSDMDRLKAACVHYNTEGKMQLVDNHDGTYLCSICGYNFKPCQNKDLASVQSVCDQMVDILQTIKLIYWGLPDEIVRDFFTIIPLIMKVPQLWQMALGNFQQYRQENGMAGYQNGGGNSVYQMFNMLANGGMAPNNGFQTGQMNQPTFNGPAMNQQMGWNGVQTQMNQFNQQMGWGQNQMQQQQMGNGYAYNPGQNIQQAQSGVVDSTATEVPAAEYEQQKPLAAPETKQQPKKSTKK